MNLVPPSPAGTGSLARVAGAVEDARPKPIAQGCGRSVYGARELPEREQRYGDQCVKLKANGCIDHEGVQPFGSSDGVRPALRDVETHDMAREHGQDAEVKQWVGPPQDAVL